ALHQRRMRAGRGGGRSRREPASPLLSTPMRLASRMRSLFASMTSAMPSRMAFFCAVEGRAISAAGARAARSFSRVVMATAGVDVISVPNLRREVRSDLSIQGELQRTRMTAVHDGNVHSGFAGHFCSAELRSHAAGA